MEMELKLYQMVQYMMESGLKVNLKKENVFILMVRFMMENGLMVNPQVLELKPGLMVVNMKESGN